MSSAGEIVGQQLVNGLQDLSIEDQCEMKGICTAAAEEINQVVSETNEVNNTNHHGLCAICLNKIVLEETALVKGCEHAYCVTCILRWASYKKEPTCPQCKNPFKFLNIHRSLDGSIHDYMFEESVCLLLRASWFKPLIVAEREERSTELYEELVDYYYNELEDEDEIYFGNSSSLRIGNRRWGDTGYVRAGRQEARPVPRPNFQDSGGAGPSRQPKKKESAAKEKKESAASAAKEKKESAASAAKETVGRRAKRALKREAADKAAAEKHQQHLVRLGRTQV